jgi:hypothetical protein
MPIPDTKYNFNTKYNYSFSKLKYDISNNSFVYFKEIKHKNELVYQKKFIKKFIPKFIQS